MHKGGGGGSEKLSHKNAIKHKRAHLDFLTTPSTPKKEFCQNILVSIKQNYWGCFFHVKITLNDGEQNDYDEEEETDVEEDAIDFVRVSVWRFDLVTDTTAGSNALVQVEHEALKQE
jgi:hypothetical protein